jgi:hypothetical protein
MRVDTLRLIAVSVGGAIILSLTQFPFVVTMQSRGDYSAALDRASDAYADARDRCDPMAGHGKDMCVVEAKAGEKRAQGTAEADYRGTIESKADSRIANADADLMVAKVACETRSRQERVICVKQARATNFRLVADARL